MAQDLGDFASLASTKASSVERPKPIPTGHYVGMFAGLAAQHKAQSGNLAFRFPVRLVEAGDDVDSEALATVGGLKPEKTYPVDFWLSPDAQWRFTEFAKGMGHSDDMTLMELAEALGTSGDQFLCEVQHNPAKNAGDPPFVQLTNLAPLNT